MGEENTARKRGGGPKTPAGKARSKMNAVKHGLRAKTVVLTGESEHEFNGLASKLESEFQPRTEIERFCVQKILLAMWKSRRRERAETAELTCQQNCVEWDEEKKELENAEALAMNPPAGGLITQTGNQLVLEACMCELETLHDAVADRGFARIEDNKRLKRIYGDQEHLFRSLYKIYDVLWNHSINRSERRETPETPTTSEKHFLQSIKNEIQTLKRRQKSENMIRSERSRLSEVTRTLPSPENLELYVRYGGNLDREIGRYISLLQTLQDRRKSSGTS